MMCERQTTPPGKLPLLFLNSAVGSFTSPLIWLMKGWRWQCQWLNVIAQWHNHLKLRSLKSKPAWSHQSLKYPGYWSGWSLNPWPPARETSALPNELTRWQNMNNNWLYIKDNGFRYESLPWKWHIPYQILYAMIKISQYDKIICLTSSLLMFPGTKNFCPALYI